MTENNFPIRRRRAAMRICEVDKHLIAKGLEPSWEDRVREEEIVKYNEETEKESGSTTERFLLENIPPHSHPKL